MIRAHCKADTLSGLLNIFQYGWRIQVNGVEHRASLLNSNRLPINQRVKVFQGGGVVVRGPTIGMHQDMPVQVEQSNEPLTLSRPLSATYQFILGLFEQQGDNRQLCQIG